MNKQIISLFLVMVLTFCMSSCNFPQPTTQSTSYIIIFKEPEKIEQKVIGELVHITGDLALANEAGTHLYLKPTNGSDNMPLIDFFLETNQLSPDSLDTDLKPGCKLEITYYLSLGHVTSNAFKDYREKMAVGIKILDNTAETTEWPETFNRDLVFKRESVEEEYYGTVLHSTRITGLVSGYIVHAKYYFTVTAFWIEDGYTTIDPELLKLLESGEVGYNVKMVASEAYQVSDTATVLTHSAQLYGEYN